MQTGRRCCNRPRLLREDRLVAFAVRGFVRAIDVRRQRNVAQSIEVFVYRIRRPSKRTAAFAARTPARDESPLPALLLQTGRARPLGNFRPGRTNASHWSGPSLARQKHFNFARQMLGSASPSMARCECTPARRPNRRAGITRVLFSTRSSSPRRRVGSCAKRWSPISPVSHLSDRRRDASRDSKGRCAI